MSRKKLIEQPYTFRELLQFIRNHLFGPSNKYKKLVDSMPKKFNNTSIKNNLNLAFVGDIMSPYNKEFIFGKKLKNFISNVDFFIGNFEGVISTNRKKLIDQIHTERTLSTLESLITRDKIILSCANNHSCDLGPENFKKSYNYLKSKGYKLLGNSEEPTIKITKDISLTAISFWSNKKCGLIATLESIKKATYDSELNILCPHWGYELTNYPHPNQISSSKKLLTKYDLIIGHHSHTPQPICKYSINGRNKFVAYSLGNFIFGRFKLKYHQTGIILKLTVGINDNNCWDIGSIHWEYTKIYPLKDNKAYVEIIDQ